MTSPLMANLITASDAAAELGKSREATVRMIQRGLIDGVCIDSRWYADRVSVRNLRKASQSDPSTSAKSATAKNNP